MAFDTYDNLIIEIQKWSKRTDIYDQIPGFIALTERRIDMSLRMKDNERRATATLGRDDKYIVLPPRFIAMRTLRILSSGVYRRLRYCPPESMVFPTYKKIPTRYTVNAVIEFDAIPDRDYQLEMTYFYGLNPLSASNPSNNVLRNYPQLYLYGALAEVRKYVWDDAAADKCDLRFDAVLAEANSKELKGRLGPAPAPVFRGVYP